MFKFKFDSEESDKKDAAKEECGEELSWDPFQEIFVEPKMTLTKYPTSKLRYKELVFDFVDSEMLCKEMEKEECFDSTIFKNLKASHSDLLPAKYEGGFKIWECTYDLFQYLWDRNIHLHSKYVLDLGCGLGMLGIFALLKGAVVHFQDYNVDVLKFSTIPNVVKNCPAASGYRFFAGDWKFFSEQNSSMKYDFILSSETIYNPRNYGKLCSVLEEKLSPNGVAFLAAKAFYFGVGGGILEFQKTLKDRNKLDCSSCWQYTDGLQREILKIKHRS